jgi:hypothetical protein
MNDIKIVLFLISLSLYSMELLLFVYIQKTIKKGKIKKNILEPLISAYKQIDIKHIVIYSAFYFSILLITKVIPFIFSIIITYQLISVAFNIFLIKQISPKQK